MPPRLVEAFGRPTWREARRSAEAAALRSTMVASPPGDGRGVVITPGFGGSARSLSQLSGWLAEGRWLTSVVDNARNSKSCSWAVGRVIEALEDAVSTTGGPVVLIGHSRGGQQSRVAAQRRPDLVSQLITLGAPVRSHLPRHFALRIAAESMRAAGRLRLLDVDFAAERCFAADLARPFGVDVPWTSIWSRTDGLVAWQTCCDPAARSVEIDCSHRGLVASVPSFEAIAAALGTKEHSGDVKGA